MGQPECDIAGSQLSGSPKSGFILGGIWIFLGSARAVAAIGEPIGWSLILGLLTALLGAAYLVSALLLRQQAALAS